MIRHTLWFVLSLSLLFNGFFAVGYLQARSGLQDAASPRDMAEEVARELKLTDDQRSVFAQLREGMRDDVLAFEEDGALAQQKLMEELAGDEPDIDRVRDLVGGMADLHHARRLAGARRFGEFLGTLSPEQRNGLTSRMRHDHHRRRMQQERLRRFDANGDGTLDEAEKAEAERASASRRAQRDERRAKMFDRFDGNGDGLLDREEFEALTRRMMEQRENGRGQHERRRGPRRGGPDGPPGPPPGNERPLGGIAPEGR